MRHTRPIVLIVLLHGAIACSGAFADVDSAESLPTTFDGSGLHHWQVPQPNPYWKIRDGWLYVENDDEKSGSTLWTKASYEDFIATFDFKFGDGVVDTGIFLRNGREQIQLGISGSKKRDMTGSPYIAGRGYPVEASNVAEVLKPQSWNRMIIVAVGQNYSVWLNGEKVLSYESDTAIARGPIGLQLHPGNEMSAWFRDIRIAQL